MKKIWIIMSLVLTLVFMSLIFVSWITEHNNYNPNKNELIDNDEVFEYLNETGIDTETMSSSIIGFYINSIQLASSNDVELTGYLWQIIKKENLEKESFGVIFPESISGTSMEERYNKDLGDSIIVGWYFETMLRQKFDYSKYPLDHKTIWIRTIPADFTSTMILVPDLDSYSSTGYDDSFGISNEIVLNNWNLTETFFDYMQEQYDTTFGLGDDHMRKSHPELSFNVVIERNFGQVLIVNLTLILVIMALLYSLLLMITSEKDKLLDSFGMSASGAIGTTSALFFSVLISHIDLRSMFGGQLVYIEMFYYLAYLFILGISILIFIFMKELSNPQHRIVKSNANLFKLLYWPIYFGIILIITFIWM